ncbi:MAG: NAD(P)/FAD-dependent oxidoreductase [Actinomycetota bacterium]
MGSYTSIEQTSDRPPIVDVAVIGAGISGLAAAASLVDAGRSVVVLESRDRVGGRLRGATLADGGQPVDLGATWFWPGEMRVAALVDRLGIATHAQHIAGDAVYQDPSGPRRLDGNPIDVPSYRFSDGAHSLAEALARTLPVGTVQRGRAVRAVSADGDWLAVEHDDGAVTARHVVAALPPALAVRRIEFSPGLPDRIRGLAAATPVWMGSTTKVVIHFDEPFWRYDGLAGSGISHIGPMRELHDMSGADASPAVLFGFVPSQPGDATVSEAEVRAQLVALFGPAAEHPAEVIIADWRTDADTSPPGVEQLTEYRTYGHPLFHEPTLDGRLHWSSTETSTVAPGHIEGALAAAERAVASINHALDASPEPQEIQRP